MVCQPDGSVRCLLDGRHAQHGDLRAGMRIKVVGLSSQPHMNGKLGTLFAFDFSDGRWEIKFGDREVLGKLQPSRIEAVRGNEVDAQRKSALNTPKNGMVRLSSYLTEDGGVRNDCVAAVVALMDYETDVKARLAVLHAIEKSHNPGMFVKAGCITALLSWMEQSFPGGSHVSEELLLKCYDVLEALPPNQGIKLGNFSGDQAKTQAQLEDVCTKLQDLYPGLAATDLIRLWAHASKLAIGDSPTAREEDPIPQSPALRARREHADPRADDAERTGHTTREESPPKSPLRSPEASPIAPSAEEEQLQGGVSAAQLQRLCDENPYQYAKLASFGEFLTAGAERRKSLVNSMAVKELKWLAKRLGFGVGKGKDNMAANAKKWIEERAKVAKVAKLRFPTASSIVPSAEELDVIPATAAEFPQAGPRPELGLVDSNGGFMPTLAQEDLFDGPPPEPKDSPRASSSSGPGATATGGESGPDNVGSGVAPGIGHVGGICQLVTAEEDERYLQENSVVDEVTVREMRQSRSMVASPVELSCRSALFESSTVEKASSMEGTLPEWQCCGDDPIDCEDDDAMTQAVSTASQGLPRARRRAAPSLAPAAEAHLTPMPDSLWIHED